MLRGRIGWQLPCRLRYDLDAALHGAPKHRVAAVGLKIDAAHVGAQECHLTQDVRDEVVDVACYQKTLIADLMIDDFQLRVKAVPRGQIDVPLQ